MLVIVNHTGICAGKHFTAGVEVDLPEEVVNALGSSAKVVGGKVKKAKEQKAPKNKMVTKKEVKNKTV